MKLNTGEIRQTSDEKLYRVLTEAVDGRVSIRFHKSKIVCERDEDAVLKDKVLHNHPHTMDELWQPGDEYTTNPDFMGCVFKIRDDTVIDVVEGLSWVKDFWTHSEYGKCLTSWAKWWSVKEGKATYAKPNPNWSIFKRQT